MKLTVLRTLILASIIPCGLTAVLEAQTGAQQEFEDRKQTLHIDDPAYLHLRRLILMFSSLRASIGDQAPCDIEITVPKNGGSSLAIIAEFKDLASIVGRCVVFGPEDTTVDPALEKEASDVPNGTVVMHTTKESAEDKGNAEVYDSLKTYLPLTRFYTTPHVKQKYSAVTKRTTDSIIPMMWLQFGKDVRWTQ